MTATGPQPTVSYAGYNRKFLSAAIGAVGSPRARQTNMHCQTRMADGFEESWRAYFPNYNLRHVFCTRLSWVAPDAVVQRAIRHSSPETKRHYQLGMVGEVREGIERANEHAYQNQKLLRFYYGRVKPEKKVWKTSVSG